MNLKLIRSSFDLLQILISIYAFLYVIFILSVVFSHEYEISPEVIGAFVLFIVFLVAFVFSWFNRLLCGLLFLIWNIGIWIVELFFVTGAGGGGIVMGLPLIVFAVFCILNALEKRKVTPLKRSVKWKIGLRILTLLYSALYLTVVIDDLTGHLQIDFLKFPGVVLIILLAIYWVGFAVYWKSEFYAGLIFVAWYIGVLIMQFALPHFASSGPWGVAGVVVLINGLFFLKNELERRKRLKQIQPETS